MRLSVAICAALLSISVLAAPAWPIGLSVERVNDMNAVTCPYCRKPIVPGAIHENAEETLSTQFGGRLAEIGMPVTGEKGEARSLNVFIYRFEERRGGNFAVDRPASVAFHTHFYDGDVLTRVMVFDEAQRPLSENLFRFFTFIRRGARWVTASELAREGVHRAVDSLNEEVK
jgi:hypothetical protein